MEDFKKRSLYDIYFKMTLEETIEYYRKLREYELKCDDKIKCIEVHKALYRLIKVFLLLDEVFSKRKVTIQGDNRNLVYNVERNMTEERDFYNNCKNKIQKDKSRVYSCTHIGRYDIETAIRGVNDSCFFVMADAGESYKNMDGLFLRCNGVTWFDMDRQLDRHYANVRQTKVLMQGGNELVFPEAAYNLEPVDIVSELHPGPFRRAIKTNSYVVPVSMEQYEDKGIKNYVLNIGRSIDVSGINIEEAPYIADLVRQEMIKLKKDIWSLYGGEKPTMEEFENDPLNLQKYQDRIDFIMRDVPSYYTIEDIVREYYKPSEVMVKSLRKIGYLKLRKIGYLK